MKDCEGCPFYDEKAAELAAIAPTRDFVIKFTAGTAQLMTEFDEDVQAGRDKEMLAYEQKDDVLAHAEEGRANMVPMFAKVPKLAEKHFDTLSKLDEIEVELTTDIEHAQATCQGPVPAIGQLVGEHTIVCSAQPADQ